MSSPKVIKESLNNGGCAHANEHKGADQWLFVTQVNRIVRDRCGSPRLTTPYGTVLAGLPNRSLTTSGFLSSP
jgi:hypothetical protein